MPFALRATATSSMRPCAWPCARNFVLMERMSGSCSGFVPSRSPIASAVRSSAHHATSDSGCSVSARWILLRLPPREGPARRLLAIHVSSTHVDRQPRRARRRLPRHQHPDLRKPALLVDVQLPPPHVGGVVHLQHHIRQRVGVHVDGRSLQPRPVRVQVQHLVGLHQPALAARRAQTHQVRRAEAGDPRAAQHREPSSHLRQFLARRLMLNGGGLADLPARLGVPVPELQTAFVTVDLARRQVERLAAREVRRSGVAGRAEACRKKRRSCHLPADGFRVTLACIQYISPSRRGDGPKAAEARLWYRHITRPETPRRVAPEDPAMNRPAPIPATG